MDDAKTIHNHAVDICCSQPAVVGTLVLSTNL